MGVIAALIAGAVSVGTTIWAAREQAKETERARKEGRELGDIARADDQQSRAQTLGLQKEQLGQRRREFAFQKDITKQSQGKIMRDDLAGLMMSAMKRYQPHQQHILQLFGV